MVFWTVEVRHEVRRKKTQGNEMIRTQHGIKFLVRSEEDHLFTSHCLEPLINEE